MHQVLYRKWRPRTFDEVSGQEHITSVLKYEVQNGDIAHAYLFCGSRGTGKTTCAKILSRAVNCEHPQNGNPCGVCAACRSVLDGTATDVVEMDAASNNGVDDIRSIRDAVIYPPAALRYRVYIIDEVHMLSGSAFNALLKTLEEPPAHIIFILATTELQKLPATIVSRCQRFEFRRIAVPVLTARIQYIAKEEEIRIEDAAAQRIAKLAQGGMRDSISLLDLCAGTGKVITPALVDEVVGSAGREEMFAMVRAVADRDYPAVLAGIDRAVRASRDLTVFWQDLTGVYRDILVMRTVSDGAEYLDLTDSEAEQLKTLAAALTKETLLSHLRQLDEAFAAMQRAGSMKRMTAEMALLRLCEPTLTADPAALLSRISQLEDCVSRLERRLAALSAGGAVPVQAPSASTVPAAETAPVPERHVAAAATPEATDTETPEVAKPAAAASVPTATRQLRPLRGWSEVLDKVTQKDPMSGSFLTDVKAYSDTQGRIVLQFGNAFFMDMLEKQGGDALLLDALGALLGKEITPATLIREVVGQKDASSPIDEIIDAVEENEL